MPIPLSEINSPNHIKIVDPAVIVKTEVINLKDIIKLKEHFKGGHSEERIFIKA